MPAGFAATYPERTLGLLLWGCFARYDWRRSFIGRYWGGDTVDDALDRLEREWGDGGDLAAMAPSLAGDDAARRAWGRAQRLSATPTAARALLRMMLDVDVRALLPAIRVPVVVLHRAGDVAVDVSHSRYMAEHIPGARYVEFPGSDHLPWIGDVEPLVAEIQELVTGRRPEPEPDRVVATVMFVDAPHEVVRSQVARFRGDLLAARGDSLGASFDGPARAIRCAEAIVAERDMSGVGGRAGLHTGECEPHDGELSGVAVDMAAEILARASPGEVLVSRTVADLVAGAQIDFADRGSHTLAPVHDSWQLLAASASASASASAGAAPSPSAPTEPAMLFRREGEYWTVAFDRKVVRMRDAKGLGYLARLLRHPHREFHVLDLLAGDAPRGNDTAREDGLVLATPDAGAVLDEPAKHAYRERIAELESEIEQARHWNDLERVARVEGELDALTRELARALGLGGRDRRAASDSERARVSVTKALRSAVRRLEDHHPELGRHLSLAVHTGTFCTYDPDPRAPVTWDA